MGKIDNADQEMATNSVGTARLWTGGLYSCWLSSDHIRERSLLIDATSTLFTRRWGRTTISSAGPSIGCVLKISRAVLLIEFLTTARATYFFDIARPSLWYPTRFGRKSIRMALPLSRPENRPVKLAPSFNREARVNLRVIKRLDAPFPWLFEHWSPLGLRESSFLPETRVCAVGVFWMADKYASSPFSE